MGMIENLEDRVSELEETMGKLMEFIKSDERWEESEEDEYTEMSIEEIKRITTPEPGSAF